MFSIVVARPRKRAGRVSYQLFLAASLTLAVSGPAWAAPAPETSDHEVTSVTMADAVRLALLHNTDSRSADLNVVSAQGAVIQASAFANPLLWVGAYSNQVRPLLRPNPNQVGASWSLPLGGKRAATIAAARAGLDAAKATREQSRRQVILNVETAFVTAMLDQAQRDFAILDHDQFHQELDLNEFKYKDGKIAYGDVLKLQIQALATDDNLRQAQEALVGARADLRRLVGEGVLSESYTLVGSLDPNPALPGPAVTGSNEVFAAAIGHRSDYLAILDQQRSAEASLKLARRTPIPDLGILADYNRTDSHDGTYDAQLSATIPLLDQNQGNIREAEAALGLARLATEALRVQILSDISKAVAEWKTSNVQLSAYRSGLVDTAKQSLEISRAAYEAGRGSILDYLDAEASYRQVEESFNAALARSILAAENLRFVAGEENP